MSDLPCELLDYIVDLLHGSQTPLKNCCLVSKSWVARTRRHLFAEVHLRTAKSLESWKGMLPDPSTSPACYTKALLIGCPQVLTVVGAEAEAEARSWIGSFLGVERLELGGRDLYACGWEAAFVLLHAFSPVIKSLRVTISSFPFSRFLHLVLTLPLLEDLTMINCHDVPPIDGDYPDGLSTVVLPSSPPRFTGSLELRLREGLGPIVDWLLSLPSGIHFRKLVLSWFREEDFSLTTALAEKCSHTLESLDIICDSPGMFVGHLRATHRTAYSCF